MSPRQRIGFSPATEETVAVFARVPASAGKKLTRAALELGRPKQEVIAELVERYAGTLGEEFAVGRATITNDPPEVLTPEQLAEFLQVDVATVLALAKKGEIPGRQLRREWRFSRSAVLAWLARDD
jgi:excisionase family DNA binding protein